MGEADCGWGEELKAEGKNEIRNICAMKMEVIRQIDAIPK